MKSYYNSTSNASLKVLEDAGGIIQPIVVDKKQLQKYIEKNKHGKN